MVKTAALCLLTGLIVSGGSAFGLAADVTHDDYDERIYKDRSYIDKSLDEFEKRIGRYPPGEQYADLASERDYRPDEQDYGAEDYDPGAKDQYDQEPYERHSLKDEKPYEKESYKDPEDLKNGFREERYRDEYAAPYNKRRHARKYWREHRWQHRHARHCLHPGKIRRILKRDGWHDFELLQQGPHRVRLRATDYDGRRFRLVLNRCNGEIVRARVLRRYQAWRHSRNHRKNHW